MGGPKLVAVDNLLAGAPTLRLGPVPARIHAAPMARVVLRVIDEGAATRGLTAGLEPGDASIANDLIDRSRDGVAELPTGPTGYRCVVEPFGLEENSQLVSGKCLAPSAPRSRSERIVSRRSCNSAS